MSITGDIRGYADAAVVQGKNAVNDILEQAQAQFGGLGTKATGAVNDLRLQAEKAVNLDAIKTAVEPYLAQARQYSAGVTDRAEGLYAAAKNDKRVGRVVTTAEQVADVVVGTVQERVVKPILSQTDRGAPSSRGAKSAPKKSTTSSASAKAATPRKAAATTRPAAKSAPRTSTARTAAPRTSTARTATPRTSTARKSTAKKAAPKA